MNFETIPADTTPEAYRIQKEALRRLSPSRRLEMACEMSDYIREVSASGVRARHPEYSEREVKLAVARLTLGEELFRQAFPGVDVRP